LKQATLLLLKP